MSGDLGQVKLGELPAGLRAAVSPLAVGKASQPLVGPEGVRIFMVCERKSPNEAELPSRDEVERRLVMQRLELRARRYLRDLRESAFLEIRA
jgi:peptidyl-prolyl cis-trans isomerase SurA